MIHTKDVRMSFGTNEVLKGINLDVKEGTIFGLIGPSGAGKTTLIKIITGQLKPSAGEAKVLEPDDSFGIMMDQFGVYDRFNCYENLKIFADIMHIDKAAIYEALEAVGLKDAIKTPAGKLSKGMKSRLQFARVIMGNPKVIFLDEPTSGLDPASADMIQKLILEKKKAGCTVFIATHNMLEVNKLCDSIALLDNGVIVESGSPMEICERHDMVKQVILPDLEGVFLKLTGGELNV